MQEINEDKALLLQFIAGDENAFGQLYRQYQLPIYQFIVKYVHAQPFAEDLTQEVFIKIWESRKNLESVQSFRSYLFTTARNHTLNAMKVAFRSEAAMSVIVNSFSEQRNPVEEALLHTEYQQFLHRTLESLPARTREIFRLCRDQGKTYEEVAAQLGISRNAVKNHMVASLKLLSASVKKEFGLSVGLFLIILYKH